MFGLDVGGGLTAGGGGDVDSKTSLGNLTSGGISFGGNDQMKWIVGGAVALAVVYLVTRKK